MSYYRRREQYQNLPAYTVTVIDVSAVVEPVTLDEAKAQLRLTSGFTADDAYITALISVARDRAEQFCDRFFTEQTIAVNWESSFPAAACDLLLPYPDLQSVASLMYTDSDKNEQTVAPADYELRAERRRLVTDSSWPSDAVNIRAELVTGPPAALENVKQAILMMLTDMYELRTEAVVGTIVAENPAVKAMLYAYRNNLGI